MLGGVFTSEETAEIITSATVKAGSSVRVHQVKIGAWGFDAEMPRTKNGLAMRARGERRAGPDRAPAG
ncbi:hypothetical protein [Jannaschia seohaensis]|uniref:hypothetical protein n=1 Tax=Jannaschia seohaensis TaxID=475081 RepID=UPI0015829BF6|nr:hypothetical protein [Jannaschia seohaensis]